MFADLLPVVAGVLFAQIAPGLNSVVTAAAAIGSGRAAGVATAAGIAAGAAVWTALVLGGLLNVVDPAAFVTALRTLAGLALVAIGAMALLRARARRPVTIDGRRRLTGRRAFLLGLGVALTNPKAAALWAGVGLYLAALGASTATRVAVAALLVASSFLVYGAYALAFSSKPFAARAARHARNLEVATGAGLVLAGLALLAGGVF